MPKPKESEKKLVYGLLWNPLVPQPFIELHMIRNGGRWKGKKGKMVGEGLAFHYKEFAKLVWPHVQWHKWNDLLYENFAKHRFIGIMGPASSGKTHTSAIFSLTTYYAFSDCITIICTSTELARLEERVWGEIKAHHKLAKSQFDWLPGYNIDSKQRIVTDSRYENVEGRDLKNALIGVPCKKGGCFPTGTMVDTPCGAKPIESLKSGDRVYNAIGTSIVTGVSQRYVDKILRLTLSNGNHIDCTEEHPILTNQGWINAIDITSEHELISTYESMCSMPRYNSKPEAKQNILLQKMQRAKEKANSLLQSMQERTSMAKLWAKKILLKGMPEKNMGEGLRSMRENIHPIRTASNILQSPLRDDLGNSSTRHDSKAISWEGSCCYGKESESDNPKQSERKKEEGGSLQKEKGSNSICDGEKKLDNQKEKWRKSLWDIWMRGSNDSRGNNNFQRVSRSKIQSGGIDAQIKEARFSSLLQAGFYLERYKTCCGNRRRNASETKENCCGYEKGPSIKRLRVVRSEILKSSCDPRFDKSKGGYIVHNIEVEGHPSFSVKGILVHNSYVGLSAYVGVHNKYVMLVVDEAALLPQTFVDAIANMNKNVRFKAIVMGNPKDTTDALGKFCEPSAELNGWDGGIDQTGGTKTWPIRWNDGVCVQLVGSDCPNMDVHPELPIPYPYLITRKAIETDIAFYGKDSVQFTMMNEGRMPRGQSASRIITRQMCLKFGALEEPIWVEQKRTKIAFADVAYSRQGGDRTIFGSLEFGKGLNKDGKEIQIISLIGTMLVPVSAKEDESPEDQIANFVKERCELEGIPPSHFYFDSTGRGSFVSSCARLWSPNVNGVEFGGRASERPVSSAIPTLCKDYYFNFVTELWWSVRLCIEAGQFRNLTQEAMEEACYREWGLVSGDKKIQVEPKAKMKEKSGRSPDIFDSIAVGIEGARRRGFVIAKLSNRVAMEDEHRWKQELKYRSKEFNKIGTLDYSV